MDRAERWCLAALTRARNEVAGALLGRAPREMADRLAFRVVLRLVAAEALGAPALAEPAALETLPPSPADDALARLALPPAVLARARAALVPVAGGEPFAPATLGQALEGLLDRRSAGVYFTPPDCADYLAGATIIPWILDQARHTLAPTHAPAAEMRTILAQAGGALWRAEQIHGAPLPRPTTAADWAAPAPATAGLPGETWGDAWARQHRLLVARALVARAAWRDADDLLAAHLDPLATLRALIAGASPSLLAALDAATRRVVVLDPACGAGALLVSAGRTLLAARRALADRQGERVDAPALARAIIAAQLAGVDTLPEAVEVARLRLWLEWRALGGGPSSGEPASAWADRLRLGDALAPLTATMAGDRGWADSYPAEVAAGGFPVIIGNPPYLERRAQRTERAGFATATCGNLYALVMERALDLTAPGGRLGLVALAGSLGTARMRPLRERFQARCDRLLVSAYSGHTCPGVLFPGAANRYAIWLARVGDGPRRAWSAGYRRFYAAERPALFATLHYIPIAPEIGPGAPKIAEPWEARLLARLAGRAERLAADLDGDATLWIYTTPIFWMKALTFPPTFAGRARALSEQYRPLAVRAAVRDALVCVLNSSLFFWWWTVWGDCYHLLTSQIASFPASATALQAAAGPQCAALADSLMAQLAAGAVERRRQQKTTGMVTFQVIDPKPCKPTIDAIDALLGDFWGIPASEIAAIQRFDLKYRLGH